MKYEITKEQVDILKKAFFDLNAPVQLYSGVVNLLDKLPAFASVVDKEDEQTKNS